MNENQATEADVNWFNKKSTNSSDRDEPHNNATLSNEDDETDRSLPKVVFEKWDKFYDMSGKKYLVIFNHRKFEKNHFFNYKRPSERKYTDRDVDSLLSTFNNLGFKTDVHHDLKHEDIIKTMADACDKDHRATSCLAVAIMSHGEDGGDVLAADRPYSLNDITNMLQGGNPGLVGKPKLIFVQACRGIDMDDGRRIHRDGGENITLPTHADTFVMFSSAEHHLAYRDSDGSWLMQSLCQVLDKYHQDYDLAQMATFVHQVVAYKDTYTTDEKTRYKKMMPETRFTLTKLLKFYPIS